MTPPGTAALRIALGSAAATVKPLDAAAVALSREQPVDLETVHADVIQHLAAVEDLEAHVRRMLIGDRAPSCTCTPGTVYPYCPTHGEPVPEAA